MPAASPSLSPVPVPSVSPLSLLQIEARFKGRIWRGDALGSAADPVVSSGFDKLDKELPGGGWPTRNLTELLLNAEGLGEISLLGPSLEQITGKGRNILLVGPPYIPYMHAWENLNIDSGRIVMARVYKPAERLWALEQGIKSAAFGIVIGWLSQVSQQMTRRLQIIARAATSVVFLFRPVSAQFEPSAAPLRVVLGSARQHALSVRVLKRRGAPAALPIRIILPPTRPFSSSAGVFSLPHNSSSHNAVDRSSLPGTVA
ncbi:protein ImuA [Nitrosovibrio tenuis]|uniref:Protein ImuA n=2 Tax=Nitrosovibrio tenuis TaxID=1233 RepID=A0A1H7LP52_9PROT|nr:protein ImuA [Nitrosovibrio tenuis]